MGEVGPGGDATWGLAGRRSLVDVRELIREKATLMQKREILRFRRVPPVHSVQFESGIFSPSCRRRLTYISRLMSALS